MVSKTQNLSKEKNLSHMKLPPFHYAITIILLLTLLILSSCGKSPEDKLEIEINKALRTNNNVEATEWKAIADFVTNNKQQFPKLLDAAGQVDNKKLYEYIKAYADGRKRSPGPAEIYKVQDSATVSANKPVFNFYIENSISMDGYVRGNTDFEDAITRMMVLTKDYADGKNLHINFINDTIHEAPPLADIANFAQQLEPQSVTFNAGGKEKRSISDINKVIRMIMNNTGNNNISVLISDCIYSLGKGGDPEGKLNIQKSRTMDIFLVNLKKSNLTTICIKLLSDFTGNYYDKDDYPTALNNASRPYYIWLIGEKTALEKFYSNIQPSTLKGYQDSFVMSYTDNSKTPYFTVLKETNKIGRFGSDRSNKDFVRAIEDIDYKEKKLQFSVAVDLSKVPVDVNYLTDTANYQLTPGYVLQKAEKINPDKLSPRDLVTVQNATATHLLTISIAQGNPLRNLAIELKKKVPRWVAATNCTDDKNIKDLLDKTFGIKYFVEGVYEAYIQHNPEQQSFFNITVTIKK
jgi:hypothetical protein